MLAALQAVEPKEVVNSVLLGLAVAGALGLALVYLHRSNRLLFWCMLLGLGTHLCLGGMIFAAGKLSSPQDEEIRVRIAGLRNPPPPPPPLIKKPERLPERLDLPLGSPQGKRDVTRMPKGTNLTAKTTGRQGPKRGAGKPIVSEIDEFNADGVPVDPKDSGLFTGTFKEVIEASDVRDIVSGGGGGGGFGTPEGVEGGDIPAGFSTGKIGGRVYFIRLKHGSGAWNAFNDGTQRLLAFLNVYFPCEGDSRAMTSAEMRDKYMSKGSQPSFLYLYCDQSFSLSGTDVSVLRDYLSRGGFLFLDSRPDPFIKDRVTRELDKILPGSPLRAIPGGHPINSFLFALAAPGIGLNWLDQKNYGVTHGGRLVVFYTMGNFSYIYATQGSNADEYYTAQYQMGANVMVYAITKGVSSGISKRHGASATVTTQTLQRLGLLQTPGQPAAPTAPGESVKIKTEPPAGTAGEGGEEPPAPEEPAEIKLLD